MVRVLDEPGWQLLPETYKLLSTRAGPSTAFELMAKLKSDKLSCRRWPAGSSQCEPVLASFWESRQFDATWICDGWLDICSADAVPGPGRPWNPLTDFDGREFYVWRPEDVWPPLDARKAKPRTTRKALGTDSASAAATEAGDTAAVAGKRKRRGKLTAEQIKRGRAYLCKHPELKPKQAYSGLRRVMKSDVSGITLWRYFFQK
jgi:hypothetical protein